MDVEYYMGMDPRERILLVALHLLDMGQEYGWLSNCDFATEEGAEVAAFAMSNGDRPTEDDLLIVAEHMLESGRLVGASAKDFAAIMMCALNKRYPEIETLDT